MLHMYVIFPDTLLEAVWAASYFAVNFVFTYVIARRRCIRGWALLYGLLLVVGPLYLATLLPPQGGTGAGDRLRFQVQRRFRKYGWLLAAVTFIMFLALVAGGMGTLGAFLVIVINKPIVFNEEVTNAVLPKLIGLVLFAYSLCGGIIYFRKVRPRVLALARSGRPEATEQT